MEFSKITSTGTSKNILIKVTLISATIVIGVVMLSKIDFPSPNKEIEKIIPNETIKIVK
tara:strand:+ start:45 stop:221 length:177 start_codon:yes stop_codon:yes gene_type:complete